MYANGSSLETIAILMGTTTLGTITVCLVCASVDLQVIGKSFAGYDFGTGSNFSGTVNGSTISLVDFSARDYFRYSF